LTRSSKPVKYASADTKILTTKGQILKVAEYGVSSVVSAAFLGLPAKLGCIYLPLYLSEFWRICLWIWSSKHLHISQLETALVLLLRTKPCACLDRPSPASATRVCCRRWPQPRHNFVPIGRITPLLPWPSKPPRSRVAHSSRAVCDFSGGGARAVPRGPRTYLGTGQRGALRAGPCPRRRSRRHGALLRFAAAEPGRCLAVHAACACDAQPAAAHDQSTAREALRAHEEPLRVASESPASAYFNSWADVVGRRAEPYLEAALEALH
jgi:hypothetical protein